MTEFKQFHFSIEYLKSILEYNPRDGSFKWLKSNSPRVKVGDLAGSLDKSTGYTNIKINGINYKAHRLAWFITHNESPKHIDHINHDKSDNRIVNIRSVSHKDNLRNQNISINNTSGVCGVYYHKNNKKWIASIKVNGVVKHLGTFYDKDEAIKFRKEAEIKYGFHKNHGEQLIKEATEL